MDPEYRSVIRVAAFGTTLQQLRMTWLLREHFLMASITRDMSTSLCILDLTKFPKLRDSDAVERSGIEVPGK
jgi:hypothetical protein